MKAHTPYSNFSQKAPKLTNEYTQDQFLQDYLEAYMPPEVLNATFKLQMQLWLIIKIEDI